MKKRFDDKTHAKIREIVTKANTTYQTMVDELTAAGVKKASGDPVDISFVTNHRHKLSKSKPKAKTPKVITKTKTSKAAASPTDPDMPKVDDLGPLDASMLRLMYSVFKSDMTPKMKFRVMLRMV